jgi:hypothetical protein
MVYLLLVYTEIAFVGRDNIIAAVLSPDRRVSSKRGPLSIEPSKGTIIGDPGKASARIDH